MNILYITNLFGIIGSSAAIRNSALIKGLAGHGHKIDVLTIQHPQSKLSKLLCSCGCDKIFSMELGATSFVQNTSKIQQAINLKKTLREIFFFPDIYVHWPDKIVPSDYHSYDVIISSSDYKSSHYVARKIKKLYPRKKWIQIWGDPWSLDSTITWISRLRARHAEKGLFFEADKIVFVSELTCDSIKGKYPRFNEKIFYVPRSYYQEIEVCKKKNNANYDIVYTGSLGVGRNFEIFLNSIDKYNESEGTIFKVHFYGRYSNEIVEKLLKYDFVTVNEVLPYEDILKIYAQSDALLFISNKSSSTQIPGKLFDYFGTNLPIICVVDNNSALQHILAKYNQCILFSDDFFDVANRIKNETFQVERSFSPEKIANDILSL